MQEMLSLAEGFPTRALDAGEVLLVDGATGAGVVRAARRRAAHREGRCGDRDGDRTGRVRRGDVAAARRTGHRRRRRPPALGRSPSSMTPARCSRPTRRSRSRSRSSSPVRLQVMTTYLADLKHQYADHEGGLGMVDVVLGTLMQALGHAQRARVGTRSRPRVLDSPRRAPAPRLPATTTSARARCRCRARCASGWARSGARRSRRASSRCGRSTRRPTRTATGARARTGRGRGGAARSTRRVPRRRSDACRSSSSATRRAARGTPRSTRRSPTSAASSASWRSTTSRVRGPSHHGHTVTSSSLGLEARAVDEDPGRARRVEPRAPRVRRARCGR